MFLANILAVLQISDFVSVPCLVLMCNVFLAIRSCSKTMIFCINIHVHVCYVKLCWLMWKFQLPTDECKDNASKLDFKSV